MALEAGTKLGPYEIVSPLGAGGMGEVYRAKDTRLDRDVAIKVLPETMTCDPERVARFHREAKVLASLNHPNIAAIYGFEDHRSETGATHFLVMELVEGETLARRLKSGAFAVEDALDIAKQVAEALEAAHEQGIIHRDLKPANVMITPEGKVKVLDFGLAKAVTEESPTFAADSPTITANYTRPGVVLGTAPYMSPEQARGKPLDKRTDIWSLGCVLYECLTGQRAFEAGTTTDVLAQIVMSEPDFTVLPGDLPPIAERLLRRCLNKDPKQRLRDAGEIRVAVEEFRAMPASKLVDASTTRTQQLRSSTTLYLWAVLALLGIASAYSLWVRDPHSIPRTPIVSRWSVALPPGSRIGWRDTGSRWSKIGYSRLVAVSTDGSLIAFAIQDARGMEMLYRRNTNEHQARPIPGTVSGRAPFFSPDGRWLGFLQDGKLRKVSLAGGSPQDICVVDSMSFDASWSSDGKSIIFSTDTGLWRVSAYGGTAERLTRMAAGEVGHHFPQISRDGQSVLFTIAATPNMHLGLLSLSSATWDIIVQNASQGRFVHDDAIVFARAGELLVAPYSNDEPGTVGHAVTVLEGVSTTPGLGGAVVTQFDISDSGTLVYAPATLQPTIDELVWVDQAGRETAITSGAGTWMHPRLSPCGNRISLDIHSSDGMRDVYIYEIERAQIRRLTRGGVTFESCWTPDGTRIALRSAYPAGFSLFWTRTDFTGEPELLLSSEHAIPNSWTPDGATLLFYDMARRGISMMSPGRDRNPTVLIASAAEERWPTLSSDGKWIAYVADESGQREVFVQSFPDLGPKHKVSINGGGEPVWSKDGSRLFFRESGNMFSVKVSYEPSFAVGAPEVLFSGDYDAAPIGHQHYDISHDGQRFLMIKHGQPSGPIEVRVVQNWFEELRDKVPTGGNP